MNFKIGQKVRIIDKPSKIRDFEGGDFPEMDDYGGQIVTITDIREEKMVDVEENIWTWDIRALIPLEFKKGDFKVGDIITLRNGDRLIYEDEGEFADLSCENDNYIASIDDINDDLKYYDDYDDSYDDENDIVKIERPIDYCTMYSREEKAKEMTVEEISKALGYEVKIVKEKK